MIRNHFARHGTGGWRLRPAPVGMCLLALCTAGLPATLADQVPQADVPLFDFESGTWAGWSADTAAFGAAPVSAAEVGTWGNRAPEGMQGSYMVATAKARHDLHPEGRLVSDEFEIDRRYLTFLLGAELHPAVRILLEVDGRPVRVAYGNNVYDLIRRGWDVSEFRGRRGRLVIEDGSGPASLLRVDDFRLSDSAAPPVGSFDVALRQESDLVRAGEFRPILNSYSFGEDQGIFHSSVVRGHDGRWHLFGALGEEADRYAPEKVTRLMHASADSLSGPWTPHGVVLEADSAHGEAFVMDPEVVYHDGRYHLFFLGSGKGFGGWKEGECLWEHGKAWVDRSNCEHGPFAVHLATSPDGSTWERHGIVVQDSPFVATPHVRQVGDEWVMYYGAAEPQHSMGKHAIAYRTSPDLRTWSSERGIAMLDQGQTTPWPEHPFIRFPQVVSRGDQWYLLAGSINNGNLSRYHVLWPFRSDSPFSWTHADTPPNGRLFVDGGADILRERDGRWFVTHGNVLAGGVWIAPLYWNDGLSDEPTPADRR